MPIWCGRVAGEGVWQAAVVEWSGSGPARCGGGGGGRGRAWRRTASIKNKKDNKKKSKLDVLHAKCDPWRQLYCSICTSAPASPRSAPFGFEQRRQGWRLLPTSNTAYLSYDRKSVEVTVKHRLLIVVPSRAFQGSINSGLLQRRRRLPRLSPRTKLPGTMSRLRTVLCPSTEYCHCPKLHAGLSAGGSMDAFLRWMSLTDAWCCSQAALPACVGVFLAAFKP